MIHQYDNLGRLVSSTEIQDGIAHCEIGPARTYYDSNGLVRSHTYYLNGHMSRLDGPTDIEYYPDGTVRIERYMVAGYFKRDNGPMKIIYRDGYPVLEEWYTDDILDRTDGPAKIVQTKHDTTEYYYVMGKLIRSETKRRSK